VSLHQEKQLPTKAVESEQVADVSPGERLKSARQTLGLTVEEVAAHLKLSEKKIEALERGDAASVAAPVFVAGYLRSYARLLDLSEELVLADFKALTAIESSIEAAASKLAAQANGMGFTSLKGGFSGEYFAKLKPLVLWVIAGLLLCGVLYYLLMNAGTVGESRDATVSAPTQVPMDIPPMSANDSENNSGEEPSVAVEETGSTMNPDASATAPSTMVMTDSKTESETAGADAAVEAQPQSELALFFNGDSWVEVKDARGERLVYLLGKAGMSRTVMGVAPFEVQLGYVPGVEIMYNGVSYDLSRFAGRRSARFHVGDSGSRAGAK
jgi:cytoskeleton protein RodZ